MDFKKSGLPAIPELERAFNLYIDFMTKLYRQNGWPEEAMDLGDVQDAKILLECLGQERLDIVCASLLYSPVLRSADFDKICKTLGNEFSAEVMTATTELARYIKEQVSCGDDERLASSSNNIKLKNMARFTQWAELHANEAGKPVVHPGLKVIIETNLPGIESGMAACKGINPVLDQRAESGLVQLKKALQSLSAPMPKGLSPAL